MIGRRRDGSVGGWRGERPFGPLENGVSMPPGG